MTTCTFPLSCRKVPFIVYTYANVLEQLELELRYTYI